MWSIARASPFNASWRRFCPVLAYSGTISQPQKRRPCSAAATPAEATPANGSKTREPGICERQDETFNEADGKLARMPRFFDVVTFYIRYVPDIFGIFA